MVQALVDGLSARNGFQIRHVNFLLAENHADIGRWRPGKVWRVFVLAIRAVLLRFRHGCDVLYYVPAPAKRGALYRDWLVMLVCRPFFKQLVLHWHAPGLGAWTATHATPIERMLTRWLLGRADLSVVLAASLESDAQFFRSRRIAVVPNGISDPLPPHTSPSTSRTKQALFLALCSAEKGLFTAAEAVLAANRVVGSPPDAPRFTFVAAGPFPDAQTEQQFRTLVAQHPHTLRHVGFADAAAKRALLESSACLLFPTRYPAEGMPLVVLESLAYDRPVIATRWRALPDLVSDECGTLVPPDDVDAVRDALLRLDGHPPPPGACRARFLRHFTFAHHLDSLAAALRQLTRE